MGCDIHLVVQAKRDGKWLDVPCEDPSAWRPSRWWDGRCYDAFAILANVRNGEGFAGVETGECLIPIAGKDTRGFPADFQLTHGDFHGPVTKDEDSQVDHGFWMGDHSSHWLLFSELLDYPHWNKVRTKVGVVEAKLYKRAFAGRNLRPNDGPHSYCGGISGPRVVVMSEMEFMQLGDAAPVHDDAYVRMRWPQTYWYSAGGLFSHLIPQLSVWSYQNNVLPQDIRLVMGFDS